MTTMVSPRSAGESGTGLTPEIKAQFRETFLDEAATLVDDLESALLALEQAPSDEAVLASAFRAAHTIKGSAAGVGCQEIASFTHQVESSLDSIRTPVHAQPGRPQRASRLYRHTPRPVVCRAIRRRPARLRCLSRHVVRRVQHHDPAGRYR